MKITKTIPQFDEELHITDIYFDVRTKVARVVIARGDDPDNPIRKEHILVDFSADLAAATATQRNVIKKFFKQIMAKAWDILETEVPDEVFGTE